MGSWSTQLDRGRTVFACSTYSNPRKQWSASGRPSTQSRKRWASKSRLSSFLPTPRCLLSCLGSNRLVGSSAQAGYRGDDVDGEGGPRPAVLSAVVREAAVMSEANVEVVRRMWEAFVGDNPENGLAFCAPDIEWD